MTAGQLVALLVAVALIAVVMRSRRRVQYTQVACPDCDGDAWDIKTIWVGLRRRKVRRPCGSCGGSPWSER